MVNININRILTPELFRPILLGFKLNLDLGLVPLQV